MKKIKLELEDIISNNACHICDGELCEGWHLGCDDLVFRLGAEEAVRAKYIEN